jgi:hypothetical protein
MLLHADQTKAIMAITRGEYFTIMLEFESKFLLVEVEARLGSADASILEQIRSDCVRFRHYFPRSISLVVTK